MSGATGAVLSKELRTWLRDPQRITTATVAVVWALGSGLLPLTFDTRLLLPWAGPALPLMAVASAYNLYSQDGTALWLTLMTGSQRADIRGRQWAYLLLFGPLTVAVSVAFTAWSGYTWAWPWVAAVVRHCSAAASASCRTPRLPRSSPAPTRTSVLTTRSTGPTRRDSPMCSSGPPSSRPCRRSPPSSSVKYSPAPSCSGSAARSAWQPASSSPGG